MEAADTSSTASDVFGLELEGLESVQANAASRHWEVEKTARQLMGLVRTICVG